MRHPRTRTAVWSEQESPLEVCERWLINMPFSGAGFFADYCYPFAELSPTLSCVVVLLLVVVVVVGGGAPPTNHLCCQPSSEHVRFARYLRYSTFVLSYHFFVPQNPQNRLRDFAKFGFGFGGGGWWEWGGDDDDDTVTQTPRTISPQEPFYSVFTVLS